MHPDDDIAPSEGGKLTIFYWDDEPDEDAGAWWLEDDYEGPTEAPWDRWGRVAPSASKCISVERNRDRTVFETPTASLPS